MLAKFDPSLTTSFLARLIAELLHINNFLTSTRLLFDNIELANLESTILPALFNGLESLGSGCTFTPWTPLALAFLTLLFSQA